MEEVGAQALAALERLGWWIERNPKPVPLPANIRKRYPDIPPAVAQFLSALKTCERADERVWLLTPRAYAGKDGSEFTWDAIVAKFLRALPPVA